MLIAILAFLVGSSSAFLTRMMVRAELEHLYTVCYYLQRRAMMLNKSQVLTLNSARNSYSTPDRSYNLPSHVQFGASSGAKGPPSAPEHVISNPITFQDNTIVFHPDGVIKPGALYLTDTSRQCTYALSSAVAQVSYLRKYQYTGSWQIIS